MRAVLVLFDSLNRKWLSPYGGNPNDTPNFQRLAGRAVTFDQSYVCSMPCMPARRDLHTGRPDFLHRPWGPLEPFDASFPDILKQNNIASHLITDHYHYFEEGGQNYHTKYQTWDFIRGQEGDPWIPDFREDKDLPPHDQRGGRPDQQIQDLINRKQTGRPGQHTQTLCFDAAEAFLQRHAETDHWFLQIECFDPHEPFFAEQETPGPDQDPVTCDWPKYGHVDKTGQRGLIEKYRAAYGNLLRQCDASLGRILDHFDRHNLWEDTMLIVGTDHGFLLGEHDHLAKNVMPLWEEIAHTPLFVWDPRTPDASGQRRDGLTQIIDWAPTLLNFFQLPVPDSMLGKPLHSLIQNGTPVRDAAIFGYFGLYANVTDGRYVYMRSRVSQQDVPLYAYTLDPAHMARRYPQEVLQSAEYHPGFSFTQGIPLMRYQIDTVYEDPSQLWGTLLYDLTTDPAQRNPIRNVEVEDRLQRSLADFMRTCEAPPEQWDSLKVRQA